jgi:hypothetical protein
VASEPMALWARLNAKRKSKRRLVALSNFTMRSWNKSWSRAQRPGDGRLLGPPVSCGGGSITAGPEHEMQSGELPRACNSPRRYRRLQSMKFSMLVERLELMGGGEMKS